MNGATVSHLQSGLALGRGALGAIQALLSPRAFDRRMS